MKKSYRYKSHEHQLVERLKYHQKRKEALLIAIFRKPNKARISLKKCLDRRGLEVMMATLNATPEKFGRINGHHVLYKSATRFEALLVVDELAGVIKSWCKTKTELSAHRQLLKQEQERENNVQTQKKTLWRERLERIKSFGKRAKESLSKSSNDNDLNRD